MPIVDQKSFLRELTVEEAMRRLVIRIAHRATLEQAGRFMIKYKVNAIFVTDEEENGIGVLSKTDLMGAYYAEMPAETPVEAVMSGPPMFCNRDDSLDKALELMRSRGVHRLFVSGEMPGKAAGVLAYPDIVGLLYRYCYRCEKSLSRRKGERAKIPPEQRLKVCEVMTHSIHTNTEADTLFQVMEGLSSNKLGATLITGEGGRAAGVLSKTDLILAYRHGISPSTRAQAIMNAPVIACSDKDLLCTAIQTMVFSDLYRLFVYKDESDKIAGVLSLSDAARVRSGTCRACMATRVRIDNGSA